MSGRDKPGTRNIPRAQASGHVASSDAARSHAALIELARELARIEKGLVALEKKMRDQIEAASPDRRESARNLVHYVALRQLDLRELQTQLAQRGLSSLGRSESYVMRSLLEVSERVNESLAVRGNAAARRELAHLQQRELTAMSWAQARDTLHHATHDIIGPRPPDRHISIMVTAPPAHEADRAWMVKLLNAGMNVLRINAAHETEREWRLIVRALEEAQALTGTPCRILVDLAGPKIRTGPITAARLIATWKPSRDELGGVTAPAPVVVRRGSPPVGEEGGTFVFIEHEAFGRLKGGDELRFRDARGKKRSLQIHEVGPEQLTSFATERAYLLEQASARIFRGGMRIGALKLEVGGTAQAAIDLKVGDPFELTRRKLEGLPPQRDAQGKVEKPGVISCTLPAALDSLEPGHRVLFDDGQIHAVVQRANKTRGDFLLKVVRTQKSTAKLRAEKGINLPDTPINVPSLSEDDLRALTFVVEHADAVSLSFVRTPEDVKGLHKELARLGRPDLGVVLKIETRAGFENLPRLLLEGLRKPPLAVMIARGDLAVEVGFERLAELQDEILWLCEATHVPTIWATQVLDTMARTGVPSRAEVTDAAASVAAECVMLNKGPFVAEAVVALSDILRRMEMHRDKKRNLFRKLSVSTFADRGPPGAGLNPR